MHNQATVAHRGLGWNIPPPPPLRPLPPPQNPSTDTRSKTTFVAHRFSPTTPARHSCSLSYGHEGDTDMLRKTSWKFMHPNKIHTKREKKYDAIPPGQDTSSIFRPTQTAFRGGPCIAAQQPILRSIECVRKYRQPSTTLPTLGSNTHECPPPSTTPPRTSGALHSRTNFPFLPPAGPETTGRPASAPDASAENQAQAHRRSPR